MLCIACALRANGGRLSRRSLKLQRKENKNASGGLTAKKTSVVNDLEGLQMGGAAPRRDKQNNSRQDAGESQTETVQVDFR